MAKDFPDWRLPLVWSGQVEALWPADLWFLLNAQGKNYYSYFPGVADGAGACTPKYYVPDDTVLLIYGFGGAALQGGRVCAGLAIAGTAVAVVCAEAALVTLSTPFTAWEGDSVQVCVTNRSGVTNDLAAYWWGWEAWKEQAPASTAAGGGVQRA